MARLLNLIRHGAVLPSGHGLFIGSSDLPLSEQGRTQAGRLGGLVTPENRGKCLVSPLTRAGQTAELAFPETEFEVVSDLREVDFGRWEQKTFDQIAGENPDLVEHWCALAPDFAFPEGESLMAFQDRIRDIAQLIVDDEADRITVVTHGGVIRGLICHFLGLSFRDYLLFNVALGSLTEIELFDGKGVLNGLSLTPSS